MASSKKKARKNEGSQSETPLGAGVQAFRDSVRRSTHDDRIEREELKIRDAATINLATWHPGQLAIGLGILVVALFTLMYHHSTQATQVAQAWVYPEQNPDEKFRIVNPEMPSFLPIISLVILVLALAVFAIYNGMRRHPRSRVSMVKHEFAAPLIAMIITITSIVAYPGLAEDTMSVSDKTRTDALVSWIDDRYGYNFEPIPINQLEQLLGNGDTGSKATNRIIVNGVIITSLREGDQLIILTSDGTAELPPAPEGAETAPAPGSQDDN